VREGGKDAAQGSQKSNKCARRSFSLHSHYHYSKAETIARINIVEGIWPAFFAQSCLIDHLVFIIHEALDASKSSIYHLHNPQSMGPARKPYKKPYLCSVSKGTMPSTRPLTALVSHHDESRSVFHMESDER
jgi:hypothetical protein